MDEKKQKGITLISLAITIIIMIILATVSINMLKKDNGIIEKGQDAEIVSDISNIKEATDVYIRQKEAKRIQSSDYCMPSTKEDLKDIVTEVTTIEGLELGIYNNFNELGITVEKGKGGKNKQSTWSGSITELEDCFVINLKTDEVLYISEGKVWKQTGNININEI